MGLLALKQSVLRGSPDGKKSSDPRNGWHTPFAVSVFFLGKSQLENSFGVLK